MILPKPGPKSNGKCPSELHLRIPEDVRAFIESYGKGSINDRIVAIIRQFSSTQKPSSLAAVRAKIAELHKERQVLKKRGFEFDEILEEFIPDEIARESFKDEIYNEVEKELDD